MRIFVICTAQQMLFRG